MVDLTKLPIGTRLKTRDGRSARLLATDIDDPIHTCAVAMQDTMTMGCGESLVTVSPEGKFKYRDETHPSDIVAVEWPKIKCMAWLQPSPGCIGGYRICGGVVMSDAEEWPEGAQPIELEAPDA